MHFGFECRLDRGVTQLLEGTDAGQKDLRAVQRRDEGARVTDVRFTDLRIAALAGHRLELRTAPPRDGEARSSSRQREGGESTGVAGRTEQKDVGH